MMTNMCLIHWAQAHIRAAQLYLRVYLQKSVTKDDPHVSHPLSACTYHGRSRRISMEKCIIVHEQKVQKWCQHVSHPLGAGTNQGSAAVLALPHCKYVLDLHQSVTSFTSDNQDVSYVSCNQYVSSIECRHQSGQLGCTRGQGCCSWQPWSCTAQTWPCKTPRAEPCFKSSSWRWTQTMTQVSCAQLLAIFFFFQLNAELLNDLVHYTYYFISLKLDVICIVNIHVFMPRNIYLLYILCCILLRMHYNICYTYSQTT